MDARAERRALMNGFGDGLARAFEFALAPAIIGVFGWLLDGWLGLRPILTIVFAIVGFIGGFIRLYYGYKAEMEAVEADTPWGRTR